MPTKIKISVAITNDRGDLLMLKEQVEKQNRPLWNIVKGTYGDHGIETIFDAARRECREEASVEVELTGVTGCYVTGDADNYTVQFNFIGRVAGGDPKLPDENEQASHGESIVELRWFSRREVIELPKEEFISEKIFAVI
mgnify:FL=1